MPLPRPHLRTVVPIVLAALGLATPGMALAQDYGPVGQAQHRDILVASDLWARTPGIMGVTLNFADIIAVPGYDTTRGAQTYEEARTAVLAAGGAWNDDVRCVTRAKWHTKPWAFTTAIGATQYQAAWGPSFNQTSLDVVQVQFSWPPRPSTLNGSDFEVTLNNGSVITPNNASVGPNFEYNEGTTVVLNDNRMGNRLPKGDPAALYPVSVRVVADATPLQLVGPKGRLASAVGLTGTNDRTPYDDQSSNPARWTGPRMIAAKLTRMSTRGENGPAILKNGLLPNDGIAIFGAEDAQYRVRIATLGGAFSPDGLNAYVSAYGTGGITVLNRNPATGGMVQKREPWGCVASSSTRGCASGRALAGAGAVAVSANGRFVYATGAKANSITVFERKANGR